MASKIAKFIIIYLIVTCLMLPAVAPAAAANGGTDVGASVTITEDIPTEIIIEPVNPIIIFGSDSPQTVHFWAHARYYNASPSALPPNLNWRSSNTSVATIIPTTGLSTIKAAGTTIISATYAGLTGYTTLTVVPDTIAPVITLTTPTDGQVFSENIITVAGTVDDPSATAHIILNGVKSTITVNPTNGNFSTSVSLETGSNNILVTANDASGNTGTSGTLTVIYDPNRPEIVLFQPVNGTVTRNPTMIVTGNIMPNTITSANLTLNGNSQIINIYSGTFSRSVTLTEGTNIVTVTAYATGYEGDTNYLGTSGVKRIVLDRTPPVITITSPPRGITCSSDKWPVIAGTVDDPGVSEVTVTFNAVPVTVPVVNRHFGVGLTTPLLPGQNTAIVTATDVLGNTSNPIPIEVEYDAVCLDVTLTSPNNNHVTNDMTQVVNGLVWDTSTTNATLYVNDVPQIITVTPGNEYSGTFTANATLSPGINIIEVTASDNATPPGTGTSGKVNVILDNTPPEITIGMNDPADSITITVTSSEPLAEAPSVIINSAISLSMTQTGVNVWSGTYGSTISPIPNDSDAYSVTVVATDKAGNSTTRSASFFKDLIVIYETVPTPIQVGTTTIEFDTSKTISLTQVSITQHMGNPSGNVLSPQGDDMAAVAFVDIIVSPDIRDNLEEVYIEVGYVPADLPSGAIESTLKLYLWDTASGTWKPVPGSGVNTDEHYIYGTVYHLSTYGAFGEMEEDDQGDDDTNGGGGGGGGARGITPISEFITPDGRLTKEIIAPSSDLRVYLTLPNGTYCTYGGSAFITWISIQALTNDDTIRSIPEDSTKVTPVYEMEPDGATFNPPILCTFKYRDNELPEGADENNLTIMRWRAVSKRWEPLPSLVDPVKNIVTTTINSFSLYTLMISPSPARFEVSNLEISSDEVEINEEVMISILVTNTGDLPGDYDVTLRINYRTIEVRTVTVAGGKSANISFVVSQKSAGRYIIDINGVSGVFTVRSPEEPEPEPETPAATDTSPDIETPTTTGTPEPGKTEITTGPEPKPTVEKTVDTGVEFRWWIFVALIAIVVVMGTALLLVIRHQKS